MEGKPVVQAYKERDVTLRPLPWSRMGSQERLIEEGHCL